MSSIDFSGPEIRQAFFIVAEKRQRTDILNIDHLNTLLRIPIWWSDYLAEPINYERSSQAYVTISS